MINKIINIIKIKGYCSFLIFNNDFDLAFDTMWANSEEFFKDSKYYKNYLENVFNNKKNIKHSSEKIECMSCDGYGIVIETLNDYNNKIYNPPCPICNGQRLVYWTDNIIKK